jgi:hypothetical protein
MKYLKAECSTCFGDQVTVMMCQSSDCKTIFAIVEGPPIAEGEPQQMPGDPQNSVPSPKSGPRGIE